MPVKDDDALARTLETALSEAEITGASEGDASAADASAADVPLTPPSMPATTETHAHGEDS